MCNLINLLFFEDRDSSIRELENKYESKEITSEEYSKELAKFSRKLVDEFEEDSELTIKKVVSADDNGVYHDLSKFESGEVLSQESCWPYPMTFIVVEEDLPSDEELDAIFLDMNDWEFSCKWRSSEHDGKLIAQSYDYGEYETGYYNPYSPKSDYLKIPDDEFINIESSMCK